MTILVTGGAGYIGSHIVKQLGKNGQDVVILDDLSAGHKSAVTHGKLYVGDSSDKTLLAKIFTEHQVDCVIHCAGSLIVPESVSRPYHYYNNNVSRTLELIQTCVTHKVPNFIFSSSAGIYGDPNSDKVTEDLPKDPISPYGRSKLIIEWMLEDIARAHPEFNYCALRYFNVAGADLECEIGQSSKVSTHLIKIALEVATGKREFINIFGEDYPTPDGTCIRDYIHVQDLAQAHLDAYQYVKKEKVSLACNLGYGKGFSVKEILDAIVRVTGVDIDIRKADRRPGDPPKLIASNDIVKEKLGWKAKYDDIDIIIKTAYDWEKKLKTGPLN